MKCQSDCTDATVNITHSILVPWGIFRAFYSANKPENICCEMQRNANAKQC